MSRRRATRNGAGDEDACPSCLPIIPPPAAAFSIARVTRSRGRSIRVRPLIQRDLGGSVSRSRSSRSAPPRQLGCERGRHAAGKRRQFLLRLACQWCLRDRRPPRGVPPPSPRHRAREVGQAPPHASHRAGCGRAAAAHRSPRAHHRAPPPTPSPLVARPPQASWRRSAT